MVGRARCLQLFDHKTLFALDVDEELIGTSIDSLKLEAMFRRFHGHHGSAFSFFQVTAGLRFNSGFAMLSCDLQARNIGSFVFGLPSPAISMEQRRRTNRCVRGSFKFALRATSP